MCVVCVRVRACVRVCVSAHTVLSLFNRLEGILAGIVLIVEL